MSTAGSGCGPIRESLGVHALGMLDPAEAEEVRRHLETCARCRAAYDEIADMPRFLDMVTPEEVESLDQATELGAERLVGRVRTDRARRRRRARGLAGIAAGAILLAGVGGAWAGSAWLAPEPPPYAAPRVIGQPVTWEATDPGTEVAATVTMNQVPWGTKVDIKLQGVDRGEICSMIVYDRTGRKWDAGSWKVAYDKGLYWSGGVAVLPAQIDRVEVLAHGYERLVEVRG
ncbi:MAG TPA: zf-HC2 domain-containing protein [Actinopolymorphaceae bacterium]